MKIKNIKVEVGENKFNPSISFELSITYEDFDKFESMSDQECDIYVGKQIRETLEAWSDAQISLMKLKDKKPKKRNKK